jgi:hypothetical protein
MTLAEFDAEMQRAADAECEGHRWLTLARLIEEAAYRRAGLECHNREPGFPCWTHNTPRLALEALAKLGVPS